MPIDLANLISHLLTGVQPLQPFKKSTSQAPCKLPLPSLMSSERKPVLGRERPIHTVTTLGTADAVGLRYLPQIRASRPWLAETLKHLNNLKSHCQVWYQCEK